MKFPKINFKKSLPLLGVLVVGSALVMIVANSKPSPQQNEVVKLPRLVRVVDAAPVDLEVYVESQGSVASRVAITLQPEVSGRIVSVSPSFVSGGYFNKGDVLVTIDPRDWKLAVIRAESRVAEARQYLAQAEAEADHARREWDEIGTGEASPLVLHVPQMNDARAKLKSAQADLADAKLDLERTEIRAPFEGRIKSKRVDIGQVVSVREIVAEIFATDLAEIRLPLADRDVALLNLPYKNTDMDSYVEPRVTFTTVVGGEEHRWTGSIVRTEGVFDTNSRVLYVVAQVKDPYATHIGKNEVPLSVGLFVEATISGKTYESAIKIPRQALRQDGNVLVVSAENRLHIRPAEVIQTTREVAIVGDRTSESKIASGAAS
jgi:RND family efflux transporter MFP subunit